MLFSPGFTRNQSRRPLRVVCSGGVSWLGLWCCWFLAATHVCADPDIRGLPFTRSYALEDIGYGSRGARLDFDRFGRVAVIREGVYAVLNDTVWLNFAKGGETEKPMTNVVPAPDGRMYFAALDSWGVVTFGSDGLLRQQSLVPPNPPDWIKVSAFVDILPTKDGVYFVSPNGVAYRDFRTQQTKMFAHPKTARAFRVGQTIYLSGFDPGLYSIDLAAGILRPAAKTELDEHVVFSSTVLDEQRTLLALQDGRLVVFDGQTLSPWPGQDLVPGRVTVFQHLVDGLVAVAVNGKGLFLFSGNGELVFALQAPEYQRITALANREPGVLWLANENSIQKVLYSSALTTFDQRLGVTIGWPMIERWGGDLYVASYGEFYRARPASSPSPTRFELMPQQAPGGVWSMAAAGANMLVGSPTEVFSMDAAGNLKSIATVRDLAHLVMTDPTHCFAIGRSEIALFEFREGRWLEPAARIGGVTFPSIAHRVRNSAWIEMGGKVGRLWIHDGRLQLDTFLNDGWTKRPWVNIGSVDGTVVLNGAPGERRFFDEDRGEWRENPALRRLLERSPIWIARIAKDADGTLWATHDDGLVRFTPRGQDYEIDPNNFDLINDRYPQIQILADNDVWVTASQSLFHIDRRWSGQPASLSAPLLVGMLDSRNKIDLLKPDTRGFHPPPRLPFSSNNLTFRFFSGSDAWRRAPNYQYRVSEREDWTTLASSEISFRGLHEGKYQLQVRPVTLHAGAGAPETFPFEILPPWHRTVPAYILFAVSGIVTLAGIVRWSIVLERKRNRMLEEVVRERTQQLESAMSKLGEETRNTATLAERSRLAGEIHDSLQQSLSGSILQLDTTMTTAALPPETRTRLNIVRSMLSYTREEIQHAVWNLESPLLQNSDLGDALKKLAGFINSGATKVNVIVPTQPISLEPGVQHHLLRIAQEAITNAVKHANAQAIDVTLELRPGAVALTVADDGKGFDQTGSPDAGGHLGLRGIRTRARSIRAELVIQSSPGAGTSICVVVPLNPSAPPDANGLIARA